MLKFWLKSPQKERETDAYSQVLTQTDPYYESLWATRADGDPEVEMDVEDVGHAELGS